jgi:hypothetical protein
MLIQKAQGSAGKAHNAEQRHNGINGLHHVARLDLASE